MPMPDVRPTPHLSEMRMPDETLSRAEWLRRFLTAIVAGRLHARSFQPASDASLECAQEMVREMYPYSSERNAIAAEVVSGYAAFGTLDGPEEFRWSVAEVVSHTFATVDRILELTSMAE